MAMASLSVNGLRSHLDEVQLLLRNLGMHILALNETNLDMFVSKELTDIRGYQQFRLERPCNGGGVSVYVRDSVKTKHSNNVPSGDLELLCIDTEPPKSKPFLVIAWYRPPGGPVCSFDKLEKNIAQLDREERMILFGDKNCAFNKKPNDQLTHNNTKHVAGIYELLSFRQLIDKTTRFTLEIAPIIDHLATTCAKNIIRTGVNEFSLSDHFMVYCIRKFNGAVEKDHNRI